MSRKAKSEPRGIQVRVPPGLHAVLRRQAFERNITMGELIAELAKYRPAKPAPAARSRAAAC